MTGHLSDAARAELHKLSPDKQVRILRVADHQVRNLTAPQEKNGGRHHRFGQWVEPETDR
jgi:hypothetical protein